MLLHFCSVCWQGWQVVQLEIFKQGCTLVVSSASVGKHMQHHPPAWQPGKLTW